MPPTRYPRDLQNKVDIIQLVLSSDEFKGAMLSVEDSTGKVHRLALARPDMKFVLQGLLARFKAAMFDLL